MVWLLPRFLAILPPFPPPEHPLYLSGSVSAVEEVGGHSSAGAFRGPLSLSREQREETAEQGLWEGQVHLELGGQGVGQGVSP